METTTGVYFATVEIDGDSCRFSSSRTQATIAPPVLTGHPVDRQSQIVLGSATLAQLHKKLGDTVVVQGDGIPARRLKIVGTATLPTIGTVLSVHPTMTTGAVIATVGGTEIPPQPVRAFFGPERPVHPDSSGD